MNRSKYRYLLNLDADRDTVRVYGNESAGRYFEIMDARTGKTVGHRLFPREAGAPAKKPSRWERAIRVEDSNHDSSIRFHLACWMTGRSGRFRDKSPLPPGHRRTVMRNRSSYQ